MPQYNFHCRDCEESFSIFASMNDSKDNINCSSCLSKNVFRVYSRILTKVGGFSAEPATVSSSSTSGKSGCGTCSSGGCSTCP